MNFPGSMEGSVTLRLTAADPAGAMDAMCADDIAIRDGKIHDDGFSLTVTVAQRDLRTLQQLADRKGYTIQILKRSGLINTARRLLRRPVLVAGIVLVLFLTLWIPEHVLFIQVQGNRSVPAARILEACQNSGIGFGTPRSEVRSERIKNALLQAIPELQWVGVNTDGCVATVTVRERISTEDIRDSQSITSLVAACDGIITRITVTGGNQICKVGQVVRSGDLLVSGYKDCGISIRAERAEGEIYATTQRNIRAVAMSLQGSEVTKIESGKRFAVIIGKKRINFCKGSGISGMTCDKIYSEFYVTLPGGFVLPLSLVVEEWSVAHSDDIPVCKEDAQHMLSDFAVWYLKDHMIAGQVLGSVHTYSLENDSIVLTGRYTCEEMIAQVKNEEIILPNGNDH